MNISSEFRFILQKSVQSTSDFQIRFGHNHNFYNQISYPNLKHYEYNDLSTQQYPLPVIHNHNHRKSRRQMMQNDRYVQLLSGSSNSQSFGSKEYGTHLPKQTVADEYTERSIRKCTDWLNKHVFNTEITNHDYYF